MSNGLKPCRHGWIRNYPEIEQRAKAEGAEIHWGDETMVVNTDAVSGTRQKLSMIATITNQGKTHWMIIDEAFNSDKLIEFLEALIKDAGRKVF